MYFFSLTIIAEEVNQSLESWTESQVSTWLRSIGVKDHYIDKIYEEEVDGRILLTLDEKFLKTTIGMKSGPSHLIIQKRDEYICSLQKPLKNKENITGDKQTEVELKGNLPKKNRDTLNVTAQEPGGSTTKEDCRPRPFDQEATDFVYVKHRVLQPESGAFNLISPCHEYKSFTVAATLERTRLQSKFIHEVLKFAIGCMNIRSNGTIHIGVVDSKENASYTHGEIIGIPIEEKDIYVDALDYIERSVSTDSDHVRQCVRPPRFIEVMDQQGTEKKYVVEVDIVPSLNIVKNKVYAVRLPNFKESKNKVEFEKQQVLRRVGAKTEPVSETDLSEFYERVKHRDTQREEAERSMFFFMPESCQDLGRKLTMLMTSGKKRIEEDKWFIFVTNKFKHDDLCHVDWLLNMNVFCVFDFDPDSKVSGLCNTYLQHHTANMHSLQTYKLSGDMTIPEFTSQLHLFDQTSWIFCNGRNDFKGNDNPCDELTWIKTKMTFLRESVLLICKQILPKGTFQVVFLLTSPVEKPLLHTFNEFFTDMEGHEDIICVCEAQENFQKWKSFAEGSCGTETLDNSSVVGMTMSHINTTLQQIQPAQAQTRKHLPVFVKGTCDLKTQDEELMCSLEILTVNHCEETREDFIDEEKVNIEQQFYHGEKVRWLNFWLAERGFVGEVIKRDAYQEVSTLLSSALKYNTGQSPVKNINIYHHPGSGGSTVARQVLWDNKKTIRCAVIKSSYPFGIVAEHALKLREYEEKDLQRCLPVLLLIEDSDKEYLDDLKNELEFSINNKRVQNVTCFILLSCRRSHDPEKKCSESPLMNVSVTHKLSAQEKKKFSGKRKDLEGKYDPDFILTFVLLSEEFNEEYVTSFVEHVLQDINRNSVTTRLIHYVALLNTYVQGSFISQSHCEALLGLTILVERFHRHTFEQSLSPQARLVFLHLKDEKTHINSISIIHPLVAQEILKQLLGDQQTQSSLAMDLLNETVLFEHRFGRDTYLSYLRALFIRRARISKGDGYDSAFALLIEHVCIKENNLEKAIELLKEAFQHFRQDPLIAQTLARLHYTYKMFEQAEHWAETAVKQKPYNSFILDTKGQVYKKWFQKKFNDLNEAKIKKTPENTADAVETALKAIECFQDCEKAAVADMDNVNNSGFFSEVEIETSLLKLILSVDVFANKLDGHSECMKYLLTEYIPLEVKNAWEPFHDRLKKLNGTMHEALEWISEELSYFQKDIDNDEEEIMVIPEEKISNPLKWLEKTSEAYGKYFSEDIHPQEHKQAFARLTPFQKRMVICKLGGGNITSILSKLSSNDHGDAVHRLRMILSLYPSNPLGAKFGQKDVVNYIFSHITLNCLSPQDPKVAHLKDLQTLCHQVPSDKKKCLPGALFLMTLLFWPEDQDTDQEKEKKYEIVQSAVQHLEGRYWSKKKDIPQRKRRIYTHFFLGGGKGLDKFVHKKKFESVMAEFTFSERRMKWFRGETWKNPEIVKVLKCVHGWTEDGVVYLEGPRKRKFNIMPLHRLSVPHGNENITFYLGFTFKGPVACNIVVT